ncbi:hypothetical protein GCM10027176_33290 [Actinoallomurus bryophytorum]|uniref:Phosphotransferase family enzyme n=1 Tax=Actinoallomurus bryophytorum TaxID=1490222 RepID=A0A543CMZ6_9ACTN|nr:aminoglycoside phosphotransferase family protein [Actinoallomurus bryophytorum]TQL98471.1 phosphotransferase family enzyme [Actinoallomurus bryophytorum]
MGRTVTALVTHEGDPLGAVGPFAVETAWWSEVGSVAGHLRRELGVPVLVLRLLKVEHGEGGRDGHVTYHAEALHPPTRVPARPIDHAGLGASHELRSPWARLDGLRELLGWAADILAAAGRPPTGPVEQHRTWNLAGLFRLPTRQGPVWLKATPRFATDEAGVIAAFARLDPGLVPQVIAAGDRRMLLEHLPGEDCWDASAPVIISAVERWVAAQTAVSPPEGLPDGRSPVIADRVRALLDGPVGGELTAGERAVAHDLVRRWPMLDDCGLPDTVVHGDFHPGNWRGDGGPPVVMDFADAHLGNPVLDGLRVRDFLPEGKRPIAVRAWADAWRSHRPGCHPARALAIGEPLGHLAYAVRYQEFLDGIEPSERIYHLDDPVVTVRRALRHA